MTYQTQAIYGDGANTSYLGATMMNPAYAQGETDWGAVLTNGIRGATQGALSGLVGGAYASGQLQPLPPPPGSVAAGGMMPILVIGVIAYLVIKG